MRFIYFKILFVSLFLAISARAFVNIGTFVPNAFNSQVDTEGGRRTFTPNPFVSFDFVLHMPLVVLGEIVER